MAKLWHDHPSVDLVVAGLLAIVALNEHVSTSGDALSSLARDDRRIFYAVLAVLAVMLLAAALTRDAGRSRWPQGCLGFAAATAAAALLLDVQDGPVRTVQLLVLFGVFLIAITTVRLCPSGTPTQPWLRRPPCIGGSGEQTSGSGVATHMGTARRTRGDALLL